MDSCSSDDESSDEEAHGQRNARHDEWSIYDRDLALAGMPWSNSVASIKRTIVPKNSG